MVSFFISGRCRPATDDKFRVVVVEVGGDESVHIDETRDAPSHQRCAQHASAVPQRRERVLCVLPVTPSRRSGRSALGDLHPCGESF